MSNLKQSIFLIIVLIGATKAQDGYPRETRPVPNFGYDGISPSEKFTDEEMTMGGEIPGEAGKDYPIFREVPATRFDCAEQQFPGYYADVEAGCQAFHICQGSGRKDSFLCPNGTIFNQEYLVCDWWYNFDCAKAQSLYSVNEAVVRAMEEADRLSAEKKSALEGYRYNSPTRFQQQEPSSPVNPPQSEFDTVVVEAARVAPRPQLPLQAQRAVYGRPETTVSVPKGLNSDSNSPQITGVSFLPRDIDGPIENSPERNYLPAKLQKNQY